MTDNELERIAETLPEKVRESFLTGYRDGTGFLPCLVNAATTGKKKCGKSSKWFPFSKLRRAELGFMKRDHDAAAMLGHLLHIDMATMHGNRWKIFYNNFM